MLYHWTRGPRNPFAEALDCCRAIYPCILYTNEVEIFASMLDKFSHFGQGTFHSTEYAETQKQRHCMSTVCVVD